MPLHEEVWALLAASCRLRKGLEEEQVAGFVAISSCLLGIVTSVWLGPNERLAAGAVDQKTALWEVTEVLRAGYMDHSSDPDFSLMKEGLEQSFPYTWEAHMIDKAIACCLMWPDSEFLRGAWLWFSSYKRGSAHSELKKKSLVFLDRNSKES